MAHIAFANEPSAPATHAPDDQQPIRYVGRQPIFDLQQTIFGYELLFCTSHFDTRAGESIDAERRMIDNVLLLGKESLAGQGRVFVNVTREAILEHIVTLLPAASTVLQIPGSTLVDDDFITACAGLRHLGYRICLDGFQPGTAAGRLIALADYVKLDYRTLTPAGLDSTRKCIAGLDAVLLADKVETEEEFRRATEQGFRFFQGFFFARPTIVQSRVVPPNQIVYLQLLNEISRPEPDSRKVERLVTSETSLCFRVLRAVNSAAMGSRSQVTSIRHALMLLGDDQFRKMITLAIASGIDGRFNVPAELVLLGLHRARFCELMAPYAHQSDGEQYLIGLISVVDAILRIPMQDVIGMLPLRKEAGIALLGQPGAAGTSLRLVECYERKDWPAVLQACQDLHVIEPILSSIYVESLAWAIEELRKAGI